MRSSILYRINGLIALLLFCGVFNCIAQQKLIRADELFDQLAFEEAIVLYEKVLKEDPDNLPAKLGIADSYRLLHDFERAATYYGKAIEQDKVGAEFYLYYGQMLQAIGRCDEAIDWFKKYGIMQPDDARAQSFIEACTTQGSLAKESPIYEVKSLNALNTEYDELCPIFYGEGIVFASTRQPLTTAPMENRWQQEAFLDLWYAQKEGEGFSDPEMLQGHGNKKFHTGPAAISDEELIFTRSNSNGSKVLRDDDGTLRLALFSAKKIKDGKWAREELVSFSATDISCGHPTISRDGMRLYFASDMPGGFGGSDIYVSERNGSNWGVPKNLGPQINTQGDEVFPVIQANDYLYFSSDSYVGLGGLDIYFTYKKNGVWTAPQNAKAPINSLKDDFGLSWNEDMSLGYFSSNRNGVEHADDLFEVKTTGMLMEGFVIDELSGEPVKNATIKINGIEVQVSTNEDGYFSTLLDKEMVAANRVDGSSSFDFPGNASDNLDPVKVVPIQGSVKDGLGDPIQNAELELYLKDEASTLVASTVSDSEGAYSFDYVPDDEYEIRGEKDGFSFDIVEPDSGSADITLYNSSDWNSPDSSAFDDCGRLPVIYYDYGKAIIKEESASALKVVLKVLSDNPEMVIELSSHTDSRSSASFNERLSQQRTANVVKWLEAHGVSGERLITRHHGETQLLNDCDGSVDCEEKQHQLNRRTEIRCAPYLFVK